MKTLRLIFLATIFGIHLPVASLFAQSTVRYAGLKAGDHYVRSFGGKIYGEGDVVRCGSSSGLCAKTSKGKTKNFIVHDGYLCFETIVNKTRSGKKIRELQRGCFKQNNRFYIEYFDTATNKPSWKTEWIPYQVR